jgi:hypothetical protein
VRRGNVGRGAGAEETPDEGKKPELVRPYPTLTRVAAQTLGVTLGHEVPGTRRSSGLDKELAVGANRLKAVMLDDEGFSRHQAKD